MGDVRLHHVNFHTALNTPVFEHDEYDMMMRGALGAAIEERQVLCVAWELMPTHVHLLIAEFEDLPRGTILKHLKGDTSRAFFHRYPALRADLLGGHLWAKGYSARRILDHRQYITTFRYIRNNRQGAGLPPPYPLELVGVE